jgi:hypothetical protein
MALKLKNIYEMASSMANLMEDDMDGFGVVYVFLQHKYIYI